MERKELIQLGADAVRNTPHLFSAYKSFLIEDWGGLPEGCFSCGFNNYFNKWKNQVLTENITKMEKQINPNKTYVLKDKSINKYLYGEVYSNYSTDVHWLKYLELKPDGTNLFLVLPEAATRTEEDQEIEDDFKKKELSDSPATEDVVVNEDQEEEFISKKTTEEIESAEGSPATEDVVEEKSKRGRKKQD